MHSLNNLIIVVFSHKLAVFRSFVALELSELICKKICFNGRLMIIMRINHIYILFQLYSNFPQWEFYVNYPKVIVVPIRSSHT